MLNVGLTGGIACGKSTVAKMFVNRGAHLIDFDRLTHEAQEPGKPAWEKIVDYFGREILQPDKKIDRVKLGDIVFADRKELNKLGKIVHPLIYQEWEARLERIEKKEKHAIVLSDVPLLFEGKMQYFFDLTMVVLVSQEDQINRLIKRNGWSREKAQKRLNSQMPVSEKSALADIVIDNKGTVADTERKVNEVWQELLQREKLKVKSH
jgi:dephospho-CoA kinase